MLGNVYTLSGGVKRDLYICIVCVAMQLHHQNVG